MVKTVQGRPGEHVAQRPHAHVDIRVLQQQLDRHGKRQHGHDLLRYAQQQQGQHAARRFEQQMQRMFHPAVETVHALHAVVHGMQFPQKIIAVAQVMHERDAAIGNQDRQQQLRPERQLDWPEWA
ncbi:hypothetical protein D3C81_1644370 [compost metagenome]